ncbi:GGDEF domain-containing protein [Clostridium sp. HBUAS56010]|uniref:GGDEF domain-containing protein n=1 Tax=Clostridium sp. HBUAS56010 TaxID=2571127 RepID=UPI0011787F2A|nr:GGDEF domain-containing protein [Clostridium sp. HBUAS56010]
MTEKERKFHQLLISILNSLQEWVVVTEDDTGQVLYANEMARKKFYDSQSGTFFCGADCPFLDKFQSFGGQERQYEWNCFPDKVFQVKEYPLLWEDRKAVVHLITDITCQKENEASLEMMAYKDELTGLNNRRKCIHTIDSYLEKGVPFCLCMMDLDDLKVINDQYGHLSGDKYIKRVSMELKKSALEQDFTCRFGGDEFVVLYKNCGEAEALRKLDAIDRTLSKAQEEYPMSVSYGAVFVEDGTNVAAESVLEIADERMYCFKRARKQRKEKERGGFTP